MLRRILSIAVIASLAFITPAAIAAPSPSAERLDDLSTFVAQVDPVDQCLRAIDPMTPVLFENPGAVACHPQRLAETGHCFIAVPVQAIAHAVVQLHARCAEPPPRGPD
ncbi:hypothetical protein SAMN02983003_3169 [Devosia enhydra]|uniref:Uncharacterized protein n=1 Tax=Devosia enhydra TaxID=665118 RepID=A0A1K2I0S7_9HYPH|nr:hypothetical protein [Devosia enhydra]SFZ85997.1 hypothetical protein SAMN02983003_3169 [Devosia enhydra]